MKKDEFKRIRRIKKKWPMGSVHVSDAGYLTQVIGYDFSETAESPIRVMVIIPRFLKLALREDGKFYEGEESEFDIIKPASKDAQPKSFHDMAGLT